MIYRNPTGEYKEMIPGIQRKDLVYGRLTHLCEFKLAAGSVIPEHHHPHEQTGILKQGRIRLTIDGNPVELGPGDAWSIPGETPHGVEVLEEALVWEVFSPPRKDFLENA